MTKDDLENQRTIAAIHICSMGYSYEAALEGFDAATELLWPEIERLKNEIESTNVLFVKHSREYQNQVADLERKLSVCKEALGFYADRESWLDLNLPACCVINHSDVDRVDYQRFGLDHYDDFGGKRARAVLKEIEGEK
jgi:hypothetical protein